MSQKPNLIFKKMNRILQAVRTPLIQFRGAKAIAKKKFNAKARPRSSGKIVVGPHISEGEPCRKGDKIWNNAVINSGPWSCFPGIFFRLCK